MALGACGSGSTGNATTGPKVGAATKKGPAVGAPEPGPVVTPATAGEPDPELSRMEVKSCSFVAAFGPGKVQPDQRSIGTIERIHIRGLQITNAMVTRMVQARMNAIDNCYRRFPPRANRYRGRYSRYLNVTMYLNSSGAVRSRPSVYPYGGLTRQMANCVRPMLRGLTFPPQRRYARINFRLRFRDPYAEIYGAGPMTPVAPSDPRAIDGYVRGVVSPEMRSKVNIARTCFSRKTLAPGKSPLGAQLRLRINGSGLVAYSRASGLSVSQATQCLNRLWQGSKFSRPPPEIIEVSCPMVAHPPAN